MRPIQKKLQRKHGRKVGRLRGWWLWEALSLALSISSVIAVVALAAKLDGTSLSSWTFVLSPSAIISALITVSKTSMLLPIGEGLSQIKWLYFWHRKRTLHELVAFDEASRGPWGSLMLFLPTRLKAGPQFLLALGGAFLTIATLTLGPFAQQIVALNVEMVAQHGMMASLPVSKAYDSGEIGTIVSYSDHDASTDVPAKIPTAFFNGLFNLSAPFEFICQSGNCTWPEFASLGVCSSCADVSAVSKVVAQYTLPPAPKPPSGLNAHFVLPPPMLNIEVSAPDGAQVAIHMPPLGLGVTLKDVQLGVGGQARPNDQKQETKLMSLAVAQVGINTRWNDWENEGIEQMRMTDSSFATIPITDLAIANVTYGVRHFGTAEGFNISFVNASLANLTVTECSISWCAKLYRGFSVKQGVLQEYIVQDISLRPTRDIPIGKDFKWTYVPVDDNAWHNGTVSMPPYNDSAYIVDQGDHVAIGQFISSMFTFPSAAGSKDGFTINRAVQAGVDLSMTAKNIADSITHVIRTNRNATSAEGTAWAQDTIVRIQWAWLSLPIALVLLGALFLVAVAIATKRSGMPLWKSSLLPYLFHGVDDWEEGDTLNKMRSGLLEEMRAMEARARLIAVELSQNEHGESRFRQSG
ncbi:hypothetical protein NUW58_g2815 [Xylaria curta]|uniref:Uncharacterized protein n=1 Tax=Xylaria curta TaxID=42375 RepID=A0ACC1PF06_9PEZI|nr:hypothetical protein NUW58_g2815 [Xylaria curta]